MQQEQSAFNINALASIVYSAFERICRCFCTCLILISHFRSSLLFSSSLLLSSPSSSSSSSFLNSLSQLFSLTNTFHSLAHRLFSYLKLYPHEIIISQTPNTYFECHSHYDNSKVESLEESKATQCILNH